jgi:hypothetical protein
MRILMFGLEPQTKLHERVKYEKKFYDKSVDPDSFVRRCLVTDHGNGSAFFRLLGQVTYNSLRKSVSYCLDPPLQNQRHDERRLPKSINKTRQI